MSSTKSITRNISQLFDLTYLLKFLLFFAFVYGFNLAFFSITSPYGDYYNAFLDTNLNYINWLKATILFGSNQISQLIGIDSYIPNSYSLKAVGGTRLLIGEACLGLGVMSFWIAYILADGSSWKRKLLWCIGGLLSIWLINCLRVAFMLLAFEKDWKLVITTDYHTAFNVIAYGFVFLQIYIYNRSAAKAES
jgi:exosortase/archaeosortase family protein